MGNPHSGMNNPRYLPIGEDEPVNLLSPYAVSKFAGEGYCKAFYESYDLPTTVVRYSNVFGPGQTPANPYCGVVAKFFEAARDCVGLRNIVVFLRQLAAMRDP